MWELQYAEQEDRNSKLHNTSPLRKALKSEMSKRFKLEQPMYFNELENWGFLYRQDHLKTRMKMFLISKNCPVHTIANW